MPQRRALIRPTSRDQERTGGVLPEARAEESALAHLLHDELFDVLGRDDDVVSRRRRVGIGQVQCDAVVGPNGLHLDPERLAQPSGQRKRPRRVNARAEGRQDAEPPVADLVAEAFDHDGAVRRNRAGRRGLLVEERQQVARCALVEPMLVGQPRDRDFVAQSH